MSRPRRTNQILYLTHAELEPHPTAQRIRVVPASLKRIMQNFNPDALGTLHVVLIQGHYYIIDGMHRWTAVRRLGLDDLKFECEVHSSITDARAASERFLQLNDRAIVDQFSKWNNEILSGDPVAVAANDAVETFGLRVDVTKKDGTVSCPATLKKIAAKDPALLRETLDILTSAYGHRAGGTDAKLLDGLATVLSRFNGEVSRDVLVRRLSKYPGGADALVGNGHGLAKIRRCSAALGVAEVILDAYNAGRKQDNRLAL